MKVYSPSGRVIPLQEPPLGSGTEGTVYVFRPTRVVKVYRDLAEAAKREQKILAMCMVVKQVPALLKRIAWPLAPVYDGKHQFCGFVMETLSGGMDLNALYQYPTPAKCRLSMDKKLRVLMDLCDTLELLHRAGQVFGDFNPNNLKVMPDGTVHFVDADSFHISMNGQTYRCPVCASGYAAPELVRRVLYSSYADCPGETFTRETDYFGLAVHIFSMIMNGCHPFDSRRLPTAGPSTKAPGHRDSRVMHHETPFFYNLHGWGTPLAAPDLHDFPLTLIHLFQKAFLSPPQDRPTPKQWKSALQDYSTQLKTCVHGHRYWRGAKSCPYCRADKAYTSFFASGPSPKPPVIPIVPQPAPAPAAATPAPVVPAPAPAAPAPAPAAPAPIPAVQPPAVPSGTSAGSQTASAAAAVSGSQKSSPSTTVFWSVTLLAALAIQLFLAVNVFPGIYCALFDLGGVQAFGIFLSFGGGLGGTIAYNHWLGQPDALGDYELSTYGMSIISGIGMAVAMVLLLGLLSILFHILAYAFLAAIVIGLFLSFCGD